MSKGRRKPWHAHKAGALPVISGVYVSALGGDTFTVNFTTDIPATAAVRYGTTSALGSEAGGVYLGTSHTVVVTSLSSETTYHYQPVAYGHDGTTLGDTDTVYTGLIGPSIQISNITETELTSTSVRIGWALNTPGTGQVRWGPVEGGPYPYASLKETSLTYSAHSQPVGTGNDPLNPPATAGVTYYYRIESSSGTGETASATGEFTTLGSGVQSGIYGNPNYTSGLQNITFNYSFKQSARFRAHQTSAITDFVFYIIGVHHDNGTYEQKWNLPGGYSGGTGGAIKVSLQRDDGLGRPDGVNIGSVVTVDPYAFTYLWESRVNYPADVSAASWSVTAGETYHIIFLNDDPDPVSNFVSTDWSNFFVFGDSWLPAGTLTEFIPRFDPQYNNDDDMAALAYYSPSWFEREGIVPIMQINYANGEHDGFGYDNLARAPDSDPLNPTITSTNQVRERFTVTGGDKNIDGLHLRVAKVSGTTADLVATIKVDGGATVKALNIPATSVPTWTSGDTHGMYLPLMDLQSLGGTYTLTNGVTYVLELSTSSGTYYMWNGRNYGWSADYVDESPMTFGDRDPGTQYSTDSGSNWTTFIGGTYDMMFFFTLT